MPVCHFEQSATPSSHGAARDKNRECRSLNQKAPQGSGRGGMPKSMHIQGRSRAGSGVCVAFFCLSLLMGNPSTMGFRHLQQQTVLHGDTSGPLYLLAFCPHPQLWDSTFTPRPHPVSLQRPQKLGALHKHVFGVALRPLGHPLGARSRMVLSSAAGDRARGNSTVAGSKSDDVGKRNFTRKSPQGSTKTLRGTKKSVARRAVHCNNNNTAESSRVNGTNFSSNSQLCSAISIQPLWGGEKGPIEAVILGKIIIDEFVLRRQPETKVIRTGLGGGSPQAAIGSRMWGARTGLVAPVGQNFAQETLSPLEMAGVDTRGVTRLKGYVTPHTQIRYEAERMIWTPGEGWDRWMELGREMLPIPADYKNASLCHIITEGAGGAEVEMAEEFMSEATVTDAVNTTETALAVKADSRFNQTSTVGKGKSKQGAKGKTAREVTASARKAEDAVSGASCVTKVAVAGGGLRNGVKVLSVEPVIHTVTEGAIESLRRITKKATVVSPDWETAIKISQMLSAERGSLSLGSDGADLAGGSLEVTNCVLHPHLMGRYELRKDGDYCSGRPVYVRQAISAGGIQTTYYIYHKTTPGCASRWFMGPQEGSAVACLYVESEAVSPDEIDGLWQEFNSSSGLWIDAPDLKVSRGLPRVTFNDTLSVIRTMSTDRGRMVLQTDGQAPTRVRAIEFDPCHLRMLIREEDLPASRDLSFASKYTEDDEKEDVEDMDEDLEDEEQDEQIADGKESRARTGDEEIVNMLERALASEVVPQRSALNASENRYEMTSKVSKVEEKLQEGGTVPKEERDRDMDPENIKEEQEKGTPGSKIQELLLKDTETALLLQRLCASSGVPFMLEGSQVVSWEDVDSSLSVTEEVQDLWRAVVEDESGDIYYWNTITDETSWERPPEMLRVSTSREIRQNAIRSVKGDVTSFDSVASQEPSLPPQSRGKAKGRPKAKAKESKKTGEDKRVVDEIEEKLTSDPWDLSPEVVLDRCAQVLGMKDGSRGILAVRRGAMGSYIFDCQEPDHMWIIPSATVAVVDPTGAGNAYSSALGYNLALLLPSDSGNRQDAVIQSACRASATGASVVGCEGMPVITQKLKQWVLEQTVALRNRVRMVPMRREQALEEAAALTPPPAPVKAVKNRGKSSIGSKVKVRGKTAQDEGEGKSAFSTRGETKGRGRGGRGKRGRGAS